MSEYIAKRRVEFGSNETLGYVLIGSNVNCLNDASTAKRLLAIISYGEEEYTEHEFNRMNAYLYQTC